MPRPSSFPLFLFVASLVLCYGQGTSEPSDEITTRRPSNLVTNVFVRGASSHNPATDEIADNSISSEQNYTNEKEISTVGDDEKISHGSVVETQRYLNGERKRDNRHRRLLLGEQTSRGRRKKSAFNEIFQQFKGIEEAYSRGQVDHPVKENRPCDDDLEQIFNSLEMSMPKTKVCIAWNCSSISFFIALIVSLFFFIL